MKRVNIIFISVLLTTSVSFYASLYTLSLDSINPWKHSHKESTFYQEFEIDKTCSISLLNIHGPILIKTWSLAKVVIEASTTSKEKERELMSIDTQLKENVLSIETKQNEKKPKGTLSYQLIIPEKANITIKTKTGAIKIKKVKGMIDAITEQGSIDIQDAANSIMANTESGDISITTQLLPKDGAITLKTSFGNIDFSCPRNSQSKLNAKTQKGILTSEHAITLAPQTVKLNKETWKKMQEQAIGTLGSGGCSTHIFTKSGNIKILEY